MGLVVSHTSSKGRHDYGTQYKLAVSPEIVGNGWFPSWWMETVRKKETA
jgi:archaeal cell division control protein 6